MCASLIFMCDKMDKKNNLLFASAIPSRVGGSRSKIQNDKKTKEIQEKIFKERSGIKRKIEVINLEINLKKMKRNCKRCKDIR